MKRILSVTLCLLFLSCPAVFAGSSFSGRTISPAWTYTPTTYGMAWIFVSLGEWNMSNAAFRTDIRFQAQYTGNLTSIWGYWGLDGGYGDGNGGTVAASVCTDDGTANHLPSATEIGSFSKVVNYNGRTCDLGTVLGGGTHVISAIAFAVPVPVVAGEIYHIVFRNSAAVPGTNWWSFNTVVLLPLSTPAQPGISDTNLQLLYSTDSGANYSRTHSVDGDGGTPVFTLVYADASIQGMPYMERKNKKLIYSTTNKTRMGFTVTGANKTVETVHFATYKNGSPGNLIATLRNSGGTALATATLDTSACGAEVDSWTLAWAGGTLNTPVTLIKGNTYYIELSASGGDASNNFTSYSIANGSAYGFDGDNFKDSLGSQAMTNGTNWGATDGYDLQAYFDL